MLLFSLLRYFFFALFFATIISFSSCFIYFAATGAAMSLRLLRLDITLSLFSRCRYYAVIFAC